MKYRNFEYRIFKDKSGNHYRAQVYEQGLFRWKWKYLCSHSEEFSWPTNFKSCLEAKKAVIKYIDGKDDYIGWEECEC